MKRQKTIRYRILLLIVALIVTTVIVMVHRFIMMNKIEEQLMKSLEDVANQNKTIMEKELEEGQHILEGIAVQIEENYKAIDSQETLDELIVFLQPFAEIYHFKRMGIVTMDGMAYCTDGYVESISDSEVYILGKKGIANVTGSIEDTIGEIEKINVLSVPLKEKKSKDVVGILFATTRTEEFRELIDVNPFAGKGYSYIIEADGNVVTDSKQLPMYNTTNVFDAMLNSDEENKAVVERLKVAMDKKLSGRDFFMADGKRYLYYAPLVMDTVQQTWYLFTIVPARVLDDRMEEIIRMHDKMLLVVGAIIIFTVLFYIGASRKDEKTLKTLAYVDSVTDGDNYYYFLEKMKNKKGDKGYFVSLDINEFKLVNSTCGILKGNETLKEVWKVVESHLKEDELAAHINADHYVMFLKGDSRVEIIERIKQVSDEIVLLASKINIISILPYFGIYETINFEEPEECYSHANQAKHLVRGNRQKNWAFYEKIDYQRVVEEKELVDCFESAVAEREFEMWYQPKYKSDDETIVGAEALVRWRRKDGSLMPPVRFIPLFERNGLIAVLDEYVFRTVCMQQKKWEKEGRKLFPISINISRASLYYENIVQRYKEILEECDVKPELVPLEITESATVDNSQIQVLVDDFRKVGFPIHLDDFGNGYSSLATLNMMHFDTLKLDKGLVDFVGDENGEKLLSYTIKLAKSLGMRITAEGVEHREQVEFLQNLKCDEIQGYYYSKPLPLKEFEELFS